MRVCISNKYHSWNGSVTGKGKFALRLIDAMRKAGVEVTTNPDEEVDIDLQFSRLSYSPKHAKRSIVRQGPVCFDVRSDYKSANKEKWRAIKHADGVVYQSRFSQEAGHRLVGKPVGLEKVIFNGADPIFYRNCPARPSEFEVNFAAVAREWLPQKRLAGVVASFDHYKAITKADACLWIAGDTRGEKGIAGRKDIRLLGNLDDTELGGLYAMADALIHLVWIDACPNVVVEALVAGCPVLCTNHGGTSELLRPQDANVYSPNGVVCVNDIAGYSPVDMSKPPAVFADSVAAAMRGASTLEVNASHLHINRIAKQYVEFFEEVLRQPTR